LDFDPFGDWVSAPVGNQESLTGNVSSAPGNFDDPFASLVGPSKALPKTQEYASMQQPPTQQQSTYGYASQPLMNQRSSVSNSNPVNPANAAATNSSNDDPFAIFLPKASSTGGSGLSAPPSAHKSERSRNSNLMQ